MNLSRPFKIINGKSFVRVDYLLGLLDCIELLPIILVGDVQVDGRAGRRRTVHLSLDGMVHPQAVILCVLLALHEHVLAEVLLVQVVDKHGLILLLLVLAAL